MFNFFEFECVICNFAHSLTLFKFKVMEFLITIGLIYLFVLLVLQILLVVYIIRALSALIDFLNSH